VAIIRVAPERGVRTAHRQKREFRLGYGNF